jgi:hypothetical protein
MKENEKRERVRAEDPGVRRDEDPGMKRNRGEEKGISYHAGAGQPTSETHHAGRSHMGCGYGYLKGRK